MLLGITYAEAKTICSHSPSGRTRPHELRAALRRYGVRTADGLEPISKSALRSLPGIALLQTNYDPDSGHWHWVVWDGIDGLILDPRPVPYKRLRVSAYLAIGDLCRQGVLPGM